MTTKITIKGMHLATITNGTINTNGELSSIPPTVLLNAKRYVTDILEAYRQWYKDAPRETLRKIANYRFVDFNADYLAPGIRITD